MKTDPALQAAETIMRRQGARYINLDDVDALADIIRAAYAEHMADLREALAVETAALELATQASRDNTTRLADSHGYIAKLEAAGDAMALRLSGRAHGADALAKAWRALRGKP